jgi:hypothetical protein
MSASRKWGAHKASIFSWQGFGMFSLSGRCSQRCNASRNRRFPPIRERHLNLAEK